jgi:hypothetical protein
MSEYFKQRVYGDRGSYLWHSAGLHETETFFSDLVDLIKD